MASSQGLQAAAQLAGTTQVKPVLQTPIYLLTVPRGRHLAVTSNVLLRAIVSLQ